MKRLAAWSILAVVTCGCGSPAGTDSTSPTDDTGSPGAEATTTGLDEAPQPDDSVIEDRTDQQGGYGWTDPVLEYLENPDGAVLPEPGPSRRTSPPPHPPGSLPKVKDLWKRAMQEWKNRDWPAMMATFEKMTSLQPELIELWRFWAWTCSCAISSEFDNYRVRYPWRTRGIKILLDGLSHNEKDVRLTWEIGWYLSNIGRVDEWRQFRALFANDDDFHETLKEHIRLDHARGPDGLPDNFLVARLWFLKIEDLLDEQPLLPRQPRSPDYLYLIGRERLMHPVMILSQAALCQIQFAEVIQREGRFGETAARAWQQAERSWQAFGEREILLAPGQSIRLSASEDDEQVARYRKLVNYDYWAWRCRIEQSEHILQGREYLHRAQKVFKDISFRDELPLDELLKRTFQTWADAFRQDEALTDEDEIREGLMDVVRQYQEGFLDGKPLPDDFPLRTFVDRWSAESQDGG